MINPAVLNLFRNPFLYGSLAAYLIGSFAIWRLAKNRYWNTSMVFTLVLVGIAGGLFGGLIINQLYAWPHLTNWANLLAGNHPNVNLAGVYLGLALASVLYIKHSRYPLWRALDLGVIGLAFIEVILWWTSLVGQPNLTGIIIGVVLSLFCGLLIWLSWQTWAQERLAGVHLAMVFLIAVVVNIMYSSWQNLAGLLELISNSLWLAVGCAIVLFRTSAKSRQLILNDLPRGVSLAFRDTFMRAFANQTAKNTQKEPTHGNSQN